MVLGDEVEVRTTLVRIVDYLKMNGITTLMTDLKHEENPKQESMISSLVDTWVRLEDVQGNGESNRILRLIKSRGMSHSNQIREFHITSVGIDLIPPYIGPSGVFTGSARFAQEAKDRAEEMLEAEEIEHQRLLLEYQRRVLNSQQEALKAELAEKEAEFKRLEARGNKIKEAKATSKKEMRTLRAGSGKRSE
jgi:circadian clock protein KaiC